MKILSVIIQIIQVILNPEFHHKKSYIQRTSNQSRFTFHKRIGKPISTTLIKISFKDFTTHLISNNVSKSWNKRPYPKENLWPKNRRGLQGSRWRALPLIHAACSRLLVFHDESSRQLEEVTLSHAPPQESPRARRSSSALTKWQLRGTHARTHRSSSGRGWPARTTPPACFLVTCGLVLHFHSANCLFIGSPRQPRSFHGVKPSPPFPLPVSPRFVAWRRGGDLAGNELRIALDPRGIRAEFRGSTQIGSSPFGLLWVLKRERSLPRLQRFDL